jgi:hypothetical protein
MSKQASAVMDALTNRRTFRVTTRRGTRFHIFDGGECVAYDKNGARPFDVCLSLKFLLAHSRRTRSQQKGSDFHVREVVTPAWFTGHVNPQGAQQ